ncbi:zeta toxin family protein [Nocardia carnea]|uniref:zeta toxin family protein n=1 Tax=Nocardia carnea TaxID=37328 RepID=UPI002455D549|nr:zeta toxin family protein [Nocardia carnea]
MRRARELGVEHGSAEPSEVDGFVDEVSRHIDYCEAWVVEELRDLADPEADIPTGSIELRTHRRLGDLRRVRRTAIAAALESATADAESARLRGDGAALGAAEAALGEVRELARQVALQRLEGARRHLLRTADHLQRLDLMHPEPGRPQSLRDNMVVLRAEIEKALDDSAATFHGDYSLRGPAVLYAIRQVMLDAAIEYHRGWADLARPMAEGSEGDLPQPDAEWSLDRLVLRSSLDEVESLEQEAVAVAALRRDLALGDLRGIAADLTLDDSGTLSELMSRLADWRAIRPLRGEADDSPDEGTRPDWTARTEQYQRGLRDEVGRRAARAERDYHLAEAAELARLGRDIGQAMDKFRSAWLDSFAAAESRKAAAAEALRRIAGETGAKDGGQQDSPALARVIQQHLTGAADRLGSGLADRLMGDRIAKYRIDTAHAHFEYLAAEQEMLRLRAEVILAGGDFGTLAEMPGIEPGSVTDELAGAVSEFTTTRMNDALRTVLDIGAEIRIGEVAESAGRDRIIDPLVKILGKLNFAVDKAEQFCADPARDPLVSIARRHKVYETYQRACRAGIDYLLALADSRVNDNRIGPRPGESLRDQAMASARDIRAGAADSVAGYRRMLAETHLTGSVETGAHWLSCYSLRAQADAAYLRGDAEAVRAAQSELVELLSRPGAAQPPQSGWLELALDDRVKPEEPYLWQAWAARQYELIRARMRANPGDRTDIDAIVGTLTEAGAVRYDGTSYTHEQISSILTHVFLSQHLLRDDAGELYDDHLDPDFQLLEALYELIAGRWSPHTGVLLEHELFEIEFDPRTDPLARPVTPWRDLHVRAEQSLPDNGSNWIAGLSVQQRDDRELGLATFGPIRSGADNSGPAGATPKPDGAVSGPPAHEAETAETPLTHLQERVLRALVGRPKRSKKVAELVGVSGNAALKTLKSLERRNLVAGRADGKWTTTPGLAAPSPGVRAADPAGPDTRGTEVAAHDWPGDYLNALLHSKGWSGKDLADSIDDSDISESLVAAVLQRSSSITIRQWRKILLALGVPESDRNLFARRFIDGLDSFSTKPGAHESLSSYLLACRLDREISQNELARLTGLPVWSIRVAQTTREWSPRQFGFWFDPLVEELVRPEDRAEVVSRFGPEQTDASDTGLPTDSAAAEETSARARTADVDWTPETADLGPGDIGLLAEVISEKPSDPSLWYAWAEEQYRLIRLWIGGSPEGEIREIVQNLENVKRKEGQPPFTVSDIKQVLSYIFVDQHWFRTADGSDYFAHFDSDFQIAEAIYRMVRGDWNSGEVDPAVLKASDIRLVEHEIGEIALTELYPDESWKEQHNRANSRLKNGHSDWEYGLETVTGLVPMRGEREDYVRRFGPIHSGAGRSGERPENDSAVLPGSANDHGADSARDDPEDSSGGQGESPIDVGDLVRAAHEGDELAGARLRTYFIPEIYRTLERKNPEGDPWLTYVLTVDTLHNALDTVLARDLGADPESDFEAARAEAIRTTPAAATLKARLLRDSGSVLAGREDLRARIESAPPHVVARAVDRLTSRHGDGPTVRQFEELLQHIRSFGPTRRSLHNDRLSYSDLGTLIDDLIRAGGFTSQTQVDQVAGFRVNATHSLVTKSRGPIDVVAGIFELVSLPRPLWNPIAWQLAGGLPDSFSTAAAAHNTFHSYIAVRRWVARSPSDDSRPMSPQELADILGVTATVIRRLELGSSRHAGAPEFRRSLYRALDIPEAEWEAADRLFESGSSIVPEKGRTGGETASENTAPPYTDMQNRIVAVLAEREECSLSDLSYLTRGAYQRVRNAIRRLQTLGIVEPVADTAPARYRLLPDAPNKPPVVAGGRALPTDGPLTYRQVRVAQLLADRPMNVPELESALGIPKYSVRWDLEKLIDEGFVEVASRRKPAVYRSARELPPEMRPVPDGPRDLGEDGDSGPDDRGGTAGVVDANCVARSAAATNAWYSRHGVAEPVIHSHVTTDGELVTADDSLPTPLFHDPIGDEGVPVQAMSWMAQGHNIFQGSGRDGLWAVADVLSEPIDNDPTPDGRLGHGRGMWITLTPRHTPTGEPTAHAAFVVNEHGSLRLIDPTSGPGFDPATYEPEDFDPATYEPEEFGPPLFDPVHDLIHGIGIKPDGHPLHPLFSDDGDATDLFENTPRPESPEEHRAHRPGPYVQGARPGPGLDPEAVRALNRYFHPRVYQQILGRVEALPDHLSDTDPSDSDLWTAHTLTTAVLRRAETALRKAHPGADARELTDTDLADEYQRILRGAASVTFSEHVTKLDLLHNLAPVLADRPEWHHLVSAPPHAVVRAVTSLAKRGESVTADQVAIDRLMHLLPDPEGITVEGLRPGLAHYPDIASLLPGLRWAAGFTNGHQLDIAADLSKDTNRKVDQRKGKSTPENWKKIFEVLQLPPKLAEEIVRRFLPDQLSDFRLIVSGVDVSTRGRILDCLARGTFTASQLEELLGLSRSTVHRTLVDLRSSGAVQVTDDTAWPKTYSLAQDRPDNMADALPIGGFLAGSRRARGMSQADLATETGMSQQTISDAELNKLSPVRVAQYLVTVAAPLRIPAEDVTAAALTFLGGTFDSPATRADDHTTVLSLVNACRIDARNNTVDRVESFGIAARKDRIQELLWHGPELAVVKRAVHLGNRGVLDQQLRRFERVMRRGGVVGEDAWRSIVAAAHSVISQTPDDSTRMRSWLSAVAASVLRDHATMPPPGPDEWLEATHGCLSDTQQGIVRLLSGRRHSASALRETLGLEPWPVDDALKQLRDMGIVKKVGGGYETTYRLVEPYEDSAEFNPPPLGHSPGVSLKRFRVAKEWSQSQLAEAAGCSERTVQHAESRTESSLRTKDSSFYTYSRLLAALDAPDSYRDLFCEFLDGLDSFRTDPAAHDSIGSWLLACRIAKVVAGAWGLTPRALSALSGVSEKVIRKTENNTVPQETVQECLAALAGPLEISKEDLNAAALRFMDGQLDSYDTDVGSHTGFVSLVNACRVGAGQAARGRVANLRIAAMQPQAIELLWEGPTVELVKTAVMSGNTGVIERMLKRFEPALRRGRPVSDEMWANIAESARIGIRDARRGIRMRHWLDGLVRAELPGDYEPAESPDPLEWAEAIAGWLSGTQIRIIELLAAQPLRTQELQELPELAGVEAESPLLELRDMGIVRVERHGKQIVNHVVEPSAAAIGSRNSVTGADGASHSPVPMVESARRVVTVALPEDSGGGSDLPQDGSVPDAAGSAGKASRSHSIEDSRAAGTILSAMKETGIDVWAIRILERYGVAVEFSPGPDARVVYAEGRRIEQGAAIGYDPVRNAVTLDAGGDPGRHRHILIVAARMAEQLAGRSTPDPSSVGPAESVDRTQDLLADAYALAYRAALITEVDGRRLGGPRFRTVEAPADPRDPLSRAYTEAYEQAFDIAWRSYDQVSHHRPMYHAAAHRAGMRAVRLSLDTLGPRVDGRDLSAHIAALRAGDNGNPTAESETPELRADSLIAGVQGPLAWRAERLAEMVAGLRAKRARGVFVVESTVEEIYSDAYAEAERALQQNPDATAPEIHAYREVLDFLREESSELTESELAVVLLDVADAVDQLDDPAWGGPRAQTVVATPGSEGPAAVRGADDHRIWRAVWDRFQELGNELGPDVRPGRTGGGPVVLSDNVLVEYHRPDSLPYLRVVARPGEHMNVLRQLSLSSSDYAGVLWNRSRDLGYWEATVGPRNELNLRSLSAAEAEGPNREPTGFAAVDRLVDHYLRLRREQRTELGLGEWLHQLGPQAFHTEEERPIPVGTLRGEFVETGFTRAREEQTLRGEVFDDTHPVSVAYDLHTRKVHIPVDPAGPHRPEHHRLEVFAVGPTHLSIHLEPDPAGGWRVPAPVGAGSPADIADADNAVVEAYENRTGREYQGEAIGNTSDTLADHFRGLTASTPEELTAQIAAFLEDPGAGPLTDSAQPTTPDPDTGPPAVDGPDDPAGSRAPDDDSTRDDREPVPAGAERSSSSAAAHTEHHSADPAGESPEFTVLSTKVVHDGSSFRMMKYKVRMPDGNVHPRDVLDVPATVSVLPVDRQGRVVLGRRFRAAVDDVVLELPSGVVTADGELPVIARRILAEYGLTTGADLSLVTDVVRSGGSSNAVTRVLVARDVDDIEGVEPPPDMLRIPLTEAISHLTGAALVDTATAVGVLAAVGEASGDIRLRPAADPPLNPLPAVSGTPLVDSTRAFGAQRLRRGGEDSVWSSPYNEVRRLELHTADGDVVSQDVITRHATVLALPWDERTDEVVLVRQYRAPLGRWIYQLPAGMLDKAGEDPLTGARRELAEEAGLAALEWSEILTAAPLPGISDEHHRIYLARNLYGIPRLDAGESDEIGMVQVRVPVDEALAMALRGEIDHGPAVISLLALASIRAGRLTPRVVVAGGQRNAAEDSTGRGGFPVDPPLPPDGRDGGSSPDHTHRTARPMRASRPGPYVTVTLPDGDSEQQDASDGFVPDAAGPAAGASHSHSIEYGHYNGRPAVCKRLAIAAESGMHTVLRLLPEAAVLEAVRDAVPVARPLASSGTRLITERLDGAPATGVDIVRPEFARAVVTALARLYRYEPGEELRDEHTEALRAAGFSTDDAPLRLMRDFLVRVAGDVHRIFPETARGIGLLTPEELAARLDPVPPKRRRSRLIHGDLYAPNIIVAGEQVRLIDWELARIGDPLADIAQYLRYLRLSGVEGYEDHRAEFLRICDELLGDDIIGGWQQDLPWVEQVYSLISTYRQLWYFARLDTPTEQAATYFHDRLRGEERFLAGTAPDAETIMALREQARREWEESPDGVLEKMDDLAQQGNADRPWTAVRQRTFLDQITATREAVVRAGRAGRIESDRAGRLWREIDELALDAGQHLSAPAPSETLRGTLRRSGDDGPRAISRRILLVGQFWDPHMGGVPVFNRQLAHGFAEAGHEVYVQVEDDIDGVDPGPGITLLSRAGDDFGAVPDVDIDLIITHSRFTGHVGRMIRALRCPDATLAHIVHSISPASHGVQGEAEAGLANERVEKAMISTADVVFGVGPVLAEYIGDLAAATHVTPALHETLPGLKFSEPLPVPEFGRTTSLYVAGRFDEPRKGFAEAADMVRQLGERGLDVSLTVRGCAPVGISRAEKLLSQRAGRKVTVLPYTTGEAELRADLANTHLVLMPSRAESFGMAGTEALAAGVPVVMPDSSGVGRFLGDARRFDPELVSGLLVAQTFTEPLPMQEWVDTVERALRDLPGAWARARQIRQELQAGGYTWRSAANRMVEAACPPSAGPARAVAGYRDADPEPPRDGAGARERAVAELRAVADRAAIPAVDHDTRTIFEERIVPELLTGPNLRPVERPKFFVFLGQAGAGKSTAITEIFDDVNQNGDGAVTLQFDEFLRYHPHFEEIRRQDEFSAHDKLKPITKEFQSMAIGYALDNRYNAVFESGPSDAVKTMEIVRSFQARGYEVELHSFAIALPESRLSAAHRFMQQHVRAGTGRWMPLEHQTAAYDGVLEFTRLAESPPPVVDSLSVRNRIDVLFENRRLPDGNWLEAPQATDILAYERTRPPTREEAHAYREKLRAFRDSITGHRDPAVREMLLCEADLIAEAARPWLGPAT